MRRRIREIVRKEFIQVFREPRMRIMLFVPPLMQLLLFGYAVNLDLENSRIAWMDLDGTPQSRELLADFQGSRYFDVAASPANQREAGEWLDRGKVQAVVRVLPGFGADVLRGRTTAVQVLVEGTNSNTASLVSRYAGELISAYGARVLRQRQRSIPLARGIAVPANLGAPSLAAEPRVWFNPELRSRNYFVPGVIVNIIMIVTLSLTALAIVREKEIGTMEQLMVTPLRPVELMIGKTLPFALVGLFHIALVSTAALLVFRVPFRGSPLLLAASGVLFLMATLGMGLFLSSVSHTQQQAMIGSFFFITPAFMLSGFAFPIRNMPEVVQWITYLNPLRYFMEIVRGIFLKGVGADVLWPQMTALACLGTGILGVAVLLFRKRLD